VSRGQKPCSVEDCPNVDFARGLCGKHYARWRTHGTTDPRPAGKESPGWGRGRPPGGVYWTKARILAALRRYAAENPGTLPSDDHAWSDLKKGRLDLPTAGAILAIWHRMNAAWLAAGVPRARLKFLGTPWSPKEKAYLLEHAGTLTLTRIGRDLGRSYASVKTMIGSKGMGITARANQGFLSAAQISQEYGAPYHRVCALLQSGALEGSRHPRRMTWLVDPAAITPAVEAELRRLKATHKTRPTDLGDYRKRYGIRRVPSERSSA